MQDENPDHENEIVNSDDFNRFLLTRLKKRYEAAFGYIYERWEKPVFSFIVSIVKSKAVAEDICQETFAKLWLTCGSIDPDKNIKTYLFLISRQLTLNYIRNSKRENSFFSKQNFDDSNYLSPDKILENSELKKLTECAIDNLPPKVREVFYMYYADNLSYKQIAEMLNTSQNNVAVQVHKARTKLGKKILIPE